MKIILQKMNCFVWCFIALLALSNSVHGEETRENITFDQESCGNGVCESGENAQNCSSDCDFDLVVVVEDTLKSDLEPSLEQYIQDVEAETRRVYTVFVQGDTTFAELRTLLMRQVEERAIEGAWLIGSLPCAWYEQEAFDTHEEFPCDIYLMDLDASFQDTDGNNVFNEHSSLQADIFVSRLIGGVDEIQDYFTKLHTFRETGLSIPQSAFIFKDNDWANYYPGSDWNFNLIYSTIHKLEDLAETTKKNYLARMTGKGAEFIYQWIHASPTKLYIDGSIFTSISTRDIVKDDHKGLFYNLFDCSAARFTESSLCLAMTYLVRTSYGLATIGSSKTGGIYQPYNFHTKLAQGDTWGDAFRFWYNKTGVRDDEWYLGIVIFGDPLLVISGDARGFLKATSPYNPTAKQIQQLRETMKRFAQEIQVGTYEEYCLARQLFQN